MRKVIFKIDVIESFRRKWNADQKVNKESIEQILTEMNPFKVTYILLRDENSLERYEIIDENGNNHWCSEYNPYEKSIFGECYSYFSKWLFDKKKPKTLPNGVIAANYVEE